MDKAYDHRLFEEKTYRMWEENKVFAPSPIGTPYTILMPPPNANASLHAGHAMYTIDDVMVRWKRMQGYSAVWIPGRDHAGFETQYVFEKKLAKEGKSRLDFDRKTLYENVYKFVEENSDLIFRQFKRLGYSADWSRAVFTLEPKVLNTVFETFKRMETEGKVYRSSYMVNYCTHCGTSLSELEVDHVDRTDPLYFMKYGPFELATVRPETKFGDTAVAVNPKDKRYKRFVGQEIEVEGLLGKFKVKVIADELVDPKFGTGVVKVTPAHDPNDFEMGKKHNLEIKQVISLDGKLNDKAGKYAGLKVLEARKIVAEDLVKAGLMVRIDEKYQHAVGVCYKCGRTIEPMIVPNWFIKVEELKKPVIKAVNDETTTFFPKRYKKQMLDWLNIMHDWPISRQIVWGIRIPVWYEVREDVNNLWVGWLDENKKFHQGPINQELKSFSLEDIEKGLQWVRAETGRSQPNYVVSENKPTSGRWLPETDTFDTWFSSGQWPLVTLNEDESKSRLPTDFIGTLSDILPFWISRMMMFTLFIKNKVPYKQVYLWSKVTDAKGQKMSKSKGNVVNPVEYIEKYGADAVRMSLVFGVAPGSNVPFSEEKIRGMRNFANKIWNLGRFLKMMFTDFGQNVPYFEKSAIHSHTDDKEILSKLDKLIKKVNNDLNKMRYSTTAEAIYEFVWHEFADEYIEKIKSRKNDPQALTVARYVYLVCLKLLHPFMPFISEVVWQELKDLRKDPDKMLAISDWPEEV